MKKYKEKYLLIMFFIGILWSIFSFYQTYKDNNEELKNTLKTTQQMSLKSVIWNDNSPLGERTSACDLYLSNSYNSLTKKHCEMILREE